MTEIAASRPYELFDSEDGTDSLEIPAGASLLVTASNPIGTELIEGELARGVRSGGRTLIITTDEPAGTVRDRVSKAGGVSPESVAERLSVIDCQPDQIGDDVADELVTQNVNTPRNLTDIGIGFKESLDRFDEAGADRIRVGVLSLSVVLSYVDLETVYRFCQTLTRAIAQDNAVGFFLVSATAHDGETIDTLKRSFDGTIEIRDGETRSARVVGLDGVDADWHEIGR